MRLRQREHNAVAAPAAGSDSGLHQHALPLSAQPCRAAAAAPSPHRKRTPLHPRPESSAQCLLGSGGKVRERGGSPDSVARASAGGVCGWRQQHAPLCGRCTHAQPPQRQRPPWHTTGSVWIQVLLALAYDLYCVWYAAPRRTTPLFPMPIWRHATCVQGSSGGQQARRSSRRHTDVAGGVEARVAADPLCIARPTAGSRLQQVRGRRGRSAPWRRRR